MSLGCGGLRDQFDLAARRVEHKICELDTWLGLGPDRATLCKLCERQAGAGPLHQPSEHRAVALVQRRIVETHRSGKPPKDLHVRKRLTRRIDRSNLRRQSPMKVRRDDVVEFQKARRRQHYICIVSRVG